MNKVSRSFHVVLTDSWHNLLQLLLLKLLESPLLPPLFLKHLAAHNNLLESALSTIFIFKLFGLLNLRTFALTSLWKQFDLQFFNGTQRNTLSLVIISTIMLYQYRRLLITVKGRHQIVIYLIRGINLLFFLSSFLWSLLILFSIYLINSYFWRLN